MPSDDHGDAMLKIRLTALALVMMLSGSTSARVYATSEQDTIRGCGYTDYGDYEPKEPRSLRSLPKSIQSKLVAHLRSRLGDEVYGRLRLDGGQIVNLDRLYEEEPDAREYEWVIPIYLLHFAIDLGLDPVEHYCAEISLDAAGNVLEELALPRSADDPGKLAIISKARAFEVAALHGVPAERAWAELVYAPASDCLEWLVVYKSEEHLSTFRERVLHLNAVDPSKYRWTEQVGDY